MLVMAELDSAVVLAPRHARRLAAVFGALITAPFPQYRASASLLNTTSQRATAVKNFDDLQVRLLFALNSFCVLHCCDEQRSVELCAKGAVRLGYRPTGCQFAVARIPFLPGTYLLLFLSCI